MLRRHSLAVPWPRSSSPLVFKPAWLICHHLGKEERKQTSSSVPTLLHFEEEMAGKPRFLWEKRPLEATAGRAHLQLQVDKYLQRFSPRPALGGPLKPCSRPPALSDLPPTAAAHIQLFSFPVERAVIESGGLFFLASPRGSQPAGRFQKDIASSRAPRGPKPWQLLSAARVSAPRGLVLRSTRQWPGSEAGG